MTANFVYVNVFIGIDIVVTNDLIVITCSVVFTRHFCLVKVVIILYLKCSLYVGIYDVCTKHPLS